MLFKSVVSLFPTRLIKGTGNANNTFLLLSLCEVYMEEPEVYEIDAELLVRVFDILDALNEIKETLPSHIVAMMECSDDEVLH